MEVLLIQRVHIGLFQFSLRFCRLPVGAQLLGAVGVRRQPHTALGGFLQPVGALQARVVLFRLPDFPVGLDRSGVQRRGLDGVGQLGGGPGPVHFLEIEVLFAPAGLAGLLLDHAAFELFPVPGNLLPRPFHLVRRPLRPPDMPFQLGGQLCIRKLEAGLALHTATSWGLVVRSRYSSVSLGKRSTKGRITLP